MKVSNKTYFFIWRVFLVILIGILLMDLVLSQFDGRIGQLFQTHIPAIVSGAIILILAGIRVNYFSYEDEYEIIHIQSKSLIFGTFEKPAQYRYEFPKRIIYDYSYDKGIFYRKLTIHLITQHGVSKVRKFNLTFVPLKKLNYVISSLESICEQNKGLAKV